MALLQPAILPASPSLGKSLWRKHRASWQPTGGLTTTHWIQPRQTSTATLPLPSASLIFFLYFFCLSGWNMTDLPFTTGATYFCRFIRNHRRSPSAFPRLFLWRAFCEKRAWQTQMKKQHSDLSFFPLRQLCLSSEIQRGKNNLWHGTVVFSFFLCCHEVSASN